MNTYDVFSKKNVRILGITLLSVACMTTAAPSAHSTETTLKETIYVARAATPPMLPLTPTTTMPVTTVAASVVKKTAKKPSTVTVKKVSTFSISTAPSSAALSAANYALSKVGMAYIYGGTGNGGYDCSGLTQAVYRAAGVSIGRTTYAQLGAGSAVSKSDLQPGDLVFFYRGSHVGIYIGNGKIVHAGTYSTGVSIASVDLMPFYAARRVA